jgi:PAS domain S-box-containing protein
LELFENSRYKATKEALAESETKFRQLYLSMNEGVALHEITYDSMGQATDYIISDVNPAFESITGLRKNEVLGKKASELYRTGEPPYLEIYAKVVSGGGPTSFETYFPPMEKHFNISVFSPEKGRFATVFSDITEHKKADNMLRDSEAEISAILDSAPMIMIMVDSERRVLKSNYSASQFSGRDAGEMNGLRAGEALRCLHSQEDPQGCGFSPACQTCLVRLTLNDTLETGNSHYQVEWHLPFIREGMTEELTFLLYTYSLKLPQKRALVCIQDVTDLKANEEKIRVLNERLTGRALELEAANKELEAFSYSVSHDLRAPLRSMDGFSQAILEDYADKLDSRGHEYLQYIRSSSQLMARLIDDLLNLSRISRTEVHLGEVNLSDLAEEAVLELKGNQFDRDVQFVITPGLNAVGDRSLLKVVFINLLGNALKFTGRRPQAKIEFGVTESNGQQAYCRDRPGSI